MLSFRSLPSGVQMSVTILTMDIAKVYIIPKCVAFSHVKAEWNKKTVNTWILVIPPTKEGHVLL